MSNKLEPYKAVNIMFEEEQRMMTEFYFRRTEDRNAIALKILIIYCIHRKCVK